jgi:hypothetical protein
MNSASYWRLRTAALAAEMKPRALRQCFETGALKLTGKDKKSTGSGTYVGLSKPRVYQAAIMKHLNKLGLAIPRAARLAFQFSDVGNIDRAPGELFSQGKTVLLVTPDDATVKNTFSFSDISNYAACSITVDLNQIVTQVNTELNKHSQKAF